MCMEELKSHGCSNCCLQLAATNFVEQSTLVMMHRESSPLVCLLSAGGVHLHCEVDSAKH